MPAASAIPVLHPTHRSSGRGLCVFDGPPGSRWHAALSDPVAVFVSKDSVNRLETQHGTTSVLGDPFRALDAILRERPELLAAGYWSYDLRYALERLPRLTHDDLHLPDCWIGLYPRPETGLNGGAAAPAVGHHDPLYNRVASSAPIPPHSHTPIPQGARPGATRDQYRRKVRRVLDYIAAGDCYQVNLSHRFTAPLLDDPWAVYERLRAGSPAPFAAYLDCGDHQVLSASPELFLRVGGGGVETHPIKGTRPRGATPEEDAALAAKLLASAKDRAELVMIVDLERNDLGRVCEYGSVRVPDLCRLESYSNVHHLVATVKGRLRRDVSALECLRAAFPGGSITGAPKIRAMEIIEELEPVRRGVYTGAIGWVDGHGNGEWSIAIRTMVAKNGMLYFHAGGGIVADSDPDAEYDETLAKARGMLAAAERG